MAGSNGPQVAERPADEIVKGMQVRHRGAWWLVQGSVMTSTGGRSLTLKSETGVWDSWTGDGSRKWTVRVGT